MDGFGVSGYKPATRKAGDSAVVFRGTTKVSTLLVSPKITPEQCQ